MCHASFLVLVEDMNHENVREEVEQTESGKHFHEEVKNEYSHHVESLRGEPDLWEQVEREVDPAIPEEVVKPATANIRSGVEGESMLEGNKSRIKRE